MSDINIPELEKMYQQCSQGTATPDYIHGVCLECKMEIILTKSFTQICEHFKAEIENVK